MNATHSNLTELSARDECLARVALANTPEDRLSLGLSAVIGLKDGSTAILRPDGTITEAGEPQPAPTPIEQEPGLGF